MDRPLRSRSRVFGPRGYLVTTRRWNVLIVSGIVLSLAVVVGVGVNSGAAPYQHLYYLPIILAGLELPWFAGPLAGVVAVILYHVANPGLLNSRYRESDII